MLNSLTIKNFVVADNIQLSFDKGFSVLIGETGAGKSVIIDAISVCCGAKASLSKIRNPEKKAFIECVFSLDDKYVESNDYLKDYLDGSNELIISTSFTAKGAVTRKINGETATQSMVKRICEDLVSIHSQGSNRSLFTEKGQLDILDKFGGKDIQKKKDSFSNSLSNYKSAQKDYEAFINDSKKEDPEFLKFKIEEIEKFHIKENEIEDCEKRLNDLSNEEKINDSLSQLSGLINSYEEIKNQIKICLNDLDGTSLADKANEIKEEFNEIDGNINEIASAQMDSDADEIDRLNQRLFDLGEIRRKYGKSTKEILDKYKAMKDMYDSLQGFSEEKEKKEKHIAELKEECFKNAKELSKEREKISKILAEKVSLEMSGLSLAENGFNIKIHQKDLFDVDGIDVVDFVVRLNKGFDFASLKDAASGGEGSRIMLALKVVLQNADPSQLLIFDEIDTGISGNVAFKAGLKLYQVSMNTQVICITHLAQVACFFDKTYYIEKSVVNDTTVTSAKELDNGESIKQLGMLLSGNENSKASLDAAKELFSEANKEKNKLSKA